MKRLIALLLCLALICSLVPAALAAPAKAEEEIWQQITRLEDQVAAFRRVRSQESRQASYQEIIDQIISLVVSSDTYAPGSLVRHGDFFFWDTLDGEGMGYSPRLRASIRETADPEADPNAFSGIETVSYAAKGGSPGSINVAAFQPYIGIDSSFSAQYENECNSIAAATGGTGTTYKTNNATIDNIAHAIETCGVVIFDSHGDTDYANGNDYTSKANTSYICLQSGTGITAADQQSVTGPYGSYKHAYNAGSYGSMHYYCVDGTAIANHMTGNSPNGLLWMAICLGMATDGLQAPLRARGLEVAYGYSQSVTFSGDYAWENYFWTKMKTGEMVKDAISYMKQKGGNKDPYEDTYPAYPIVVSSEDAYPGHGNVDKVQNVYSTWTLFTQYEITAVSNNESWGTVSVSGNTITASPKQGFYTESAEVLEGTASVTVNGDAIQVNAESDCTVQVNFAAKNPAHIHFSVPDGVSCDDINSYQNDTILLPAPSGTPTGDAHSYRFLGWAYAPVEDDVNLLPDILKAGTKMVLTETELTFYALYSYFVAEDGMADGQFVKVTQAPSSWGGDYVITYNGEVGLDASGDYTGASIGGSAAAHNLADVGCTVEGDNLFDVPDSLIYTIEPSNNGTYSIKMKDQELYLALTSNSNALYTASVCSKDTARWNLSFSGSSPVITSAQYSTRTLQYNSKSGLFRCYASSQQPLTLYAAAKGETWYTTVPKDSTGCETHSFGDWSVVTAPDCTEAGSQKRVCTVCGYTETQTLPALGHDYTDVGTEPTCTEPGVITHTCSRCGDSFTENVEALGHDYSDVVTAPTCTEAGYTTHICSRCGDSYEDGNVEALGHNWDAGVITTAPTAEVDGVKTYTCQRCGETKTETVSFRFNDVQNENDYFYDPVYWALHHDPQITQGTSDTTFSPYANCTRAQVVTFLWRAAGEPEPAAETAQNCPFLDVDVNAYYFKAMLWAVEKEITSGTGDTTFSPNDICTRAQVVTFLYRANGEPQVTAANPFKDVKTTDYYYNAVLWAYSKEITTGATDTTFAPNGHCTRAQVVTFLYRAENAA